MNFRRVERLENLLYCHFLSSIHSIEPITCGGYFFAYFFILDVPVLWICSCHITVQMHWAYLIWKHFEHFTLNKVHNAKEEKTENPQLTQRIRIYIERERRWSGCRDLQLFALVRFGFTSMCNKNWFDWNFISIDIHFQYQYFMIFFRRWYWAFECIIYVWRILWSGVNNKFGWAYLFLPLENWKRKKKSIKSLK